MKCLIMYWVQGVSSLSLRVSQYSCERLWRDPKGPCKLHLQAALGVGSSSVLLMVLSLFFSIIFVIHFRDQYRHSPRRFTAREMKCKQQIGFPFITHREEVSTHSWFLTLRFRNYRHSSVGHRYLPNNFNSCSGQVSHFIVDLHPLLLRKVKVPFCFLQALK